MNGFKEYLDKMGYSWNDFDRPYEMQNLIEQFTNEKVSQALSLHNVSQQRELFDAILDFTEDLPMCSEDYNRDTLYKRYIAENCG